MLSMQHTTARATNKLSMNNKVTTHESYDVNYLQIPSSPALPLACESRATDMCNATDANTRPTRDGMRSTDKSWVRSVKHGRINLPIPLNDVS